MKNVISLFALIGLLCFATQLKAQYVTIPDANFRAFLQQQYPTCFNAQGKMDTTCAAIMTVAQLNCSNQNIANLTGVQYFGSLQTLDCSLNMLTGTLAQMPNSLGTLNCSFNNLTAFGYLPTSLQTLDCNGNFMTMLNGLPDGLLALHCGIPDLQSLPTLPSGLIYLDCQNCGITALPALPNSLVHLDVQNAHLTILPDSLPPNLQYLSLFNNPQLSCLPPLPLSLWGLGTNDTQITCMPNYTTAITATNATLPLCITNTCLPALCDGSGTDCVFPGDANHDGICTNFDVLPISVLNGQTGVVRPNSSSNWYGQPSINWNVTIPNTNFDAKFADATGGSTIDSADIDAIYINYNRTNNGTIPTNRSGNNSGNNTNAVFPISLAFTRDTFNISVSDTITADILIGSPTLIATNFYGIAASITYDSAFFRPISIQYNDASFMGNSQRVNVFAIKNTSAQKYDIAIARRTHTNVTGQGNVARIKGIIAENVAGKGARSRLRNSIGFSLGLTDVLAINNLNQPLVNNPIGDQCQLLGVTVATENTTELLQNITIQPNPVHENGVLQINAKNCAIQRIELCDVLGNVLLSQKNTTSIFLQNLSPALYFVRIYTDKGFCTKKIVVQ